MLGPPLHTVISSARSHIITGYSSVKRAGERTTVRSAGHSTLTEMLDAKILQVGCSQDFLGRVAGQAGINNLL